MSNLNFSILGHRAARSAYDLSQQLIMKTLKMYLRISLKSFDPPNHRSTDQYDGICSLTVVATRRTVDRKQRQQQIIDNNIHRGARSTA